MSLNLVQEAVAERVGDSGQPTPESGTSEGNFLLVWAQSNGQESEFSLEIDQPGWDLIIGAGTAYNWLGVWFKPDCDNDETIPTVSDTGYQLNVGFLEFSGLLTSGPQGVIDTFQAVVQDDPCQ